MAPTRMKLRVRRRDAAAGAAGDAQPEQQERSRGDVGRSSRRKNASNASATPAAASPSPPPTSSASASVRAVMAAEEASPDSKCPICLDRFNNLAYLDRCLHRFCFPCIQEWSHNKPECPLCKQPFTSILHSVRAENDFKEYTLRPAPADSSIAATVAMVAAMASRIDHQMRLQLRRHRAEDGGETTTRRRRRERGGGGGGGVSRRAGERTRVLEWYLDSNPLPPPPPHLPPVGTDDSDEAENLAQQSLRAEADLAERGVIFEGLTGLGGAVAPMGPNDRASRRLMTRLATRQRMQREGGSVRRLREREMVAFRRALYRCGVRVRGVAGAGAQLGQEQRDITAESFRQHSAHLNRLRPWLRRELTVLYGAHAVLVHIVQRIIMARLARHGLQDTPTIEEELRPFLLARTDHFLHELVSFARSPLSLDSYDLQAVYEAPAAAVELDAASSSSDSSSVIAISEGEEEERQGRSVDIQSGGCLSLSAWDDETPGPSYSTADPSCSLASLSFSPDPHEVFGEGGGGKQGEAEEECLIVGYKKPIAERTPELVQLSSDTEEEEEAKKEEEERLSPLPPTAPPLSYLPPLPPSTSGVYRDVQDEPVEEDGRADGRPSCARSCSGSSGRSHESVFTSSPSERRRGSRRERTQSGSEAARETRRRRRRRGRERSSDWLRKSGTLYNPNRSIYPAMMLHRSASPSRSSLASGSPLPPSPPESSWGYNCSPLTSSASSPSHSSSSPLSSSPRPSLPPQTPPTPSLSPRNPYDGEKPGGKRKYKSRHLDSNDKDPTWRPSSGPRKEKRRKRVEKERRRRSGRRERHRRGSAKESGDCGGESSRTCREDRSPSVEIVYEGTVTAEAAEPPACKRRRKRQRRTQHSRCSSSPVIITLDSDSSRGDVNSQRSISSGGGSSPLSSQQTVDFSDFPALPLVHPGGGDLPVHILDRGSDGSDTEPVGRPEAAGPDTSDHEVDVETVEGSGSAPGSDEQPSNQEPIKTADSSAGGRRGEPAAVAGGSAPTGHCDGRLLTVLSGLEGIAPPKHGFAFDFEPSRSPETRSSRFRVPCEVSGSMEQPKSAATPDRGLLACQLPVGRPGEQGAREQGPREQGPREQGAERLGRAGPRQLEDARDLGSFPLPPASIHLPAIAHGDAVDVDPSVGPAPAPPPAHLHLAAVTAPKRHVAGSLAWRKEPVPTSNMSATHSRPSCHLVPSAGAAMCDQLAQSLGLDLNGPSSFLPPHDGTNTSSALNLHPVNLSPGDFRSATMGWATESPAQVDSTSGRCRDPLRLPPDLRPCGSVSATDASSGGGVFSGVSANNTSPPAPESSTPEPNSPVDSRSPHREEGRFERLPVGAAPSGRPSPADPRPRSRTAEACGAASGACGAASGACGAASGASGACGATPGACGAAPGACGAASGACGAAPGATTSRGSFAVSDEAPSARGLQPPTDLCSTGPAPLAGPTIAPAARPAVPPPPPDLTPRQAPQLKPACETTRRNHLPPPADPYAKHNAPVDSHPNSSLTDFRRHTGNHVASSPQPGGVWSAHALSHRTNE